MSLENIAQAVASRLNMLFSGHVISGLSDETRFIGIALSYLVLLILLVLIVTRLDRRSASYVFLFVSLLLLYLFIPFQVQVRWVPERTTIYLLLSAFLAISVLLSSKHSRLKMDPGSFIVVSATLLIAYSSYHHSINHIKVNEYFSEYMAGLDKVESNSTILAIRVVSPMPDKVGSHLLHKLLQGGSYYAVLRNSVDVKLFQTKTKVVPIVFKESKNPYKHWIKDTEVISLVPLVDFEGFSNISERPLDYVLLWGNLQEASRYKELISPLNRLLSDLDKNFDLIHVSSPSGLMHLFKNKNQFEKITESDLSNRDPFK